MKRRNKRKRKTLKDQKDKNPFSGVRKKITFSTVTQKISGKKRYVRRKDKPIKDEER